MPTESFFKEFVIDDKKLARELLRDMKNNKVVCTLGQDDAKLEEYLAGGKDILKKLSPSKNKTL